MTVFTAQGLCLSLKQYSVCVQIRSKSNLAQRRGKEKADLSPAKHHLSAAWG